MGKNSILSTVIDRIFTKCQVCEKMVSEKIYAIYHADGGIFGELAYVWGKITGSAHCALCDITHSGVSMKRKWKELMKDLDVEFELLHLNEQFPKLAEFTRQRTPCVVMSNSEGLKMIIDADKLEECNKSVESFQGALESALT